MYFTCRSRNSRAVMPPLLRMWGVQLITLFAFAFIFSLDISRKINGFHLIVFGARVRKEYRAGDARGAPWIVPKGWKWRSGCGGSLVGVIVSRWWKLSGWTWKDSVARAFSKLRQPRCRPVVFLPPSAEYRRDSYRGYVREEGLARIRCATNPVFLLAFSLQ